MKSLRELDNIQLLYDVKKDALKPIDELVDDSGIGCLVEFTQTIKEKSIVILEKEIHYYPKDIPLFVDVANGIKHIRSGIREEKLLEILTQDYWSNKDTNSKIAFDKYLTIITLMKITEDISPRRMQQILLQQLMELNEISGIGKEW